MPDAQKRTPPPLDCPTCVVKETETSRRLKHCGWLPEASWTAGPIRQLPALGPTRYDLRVCPGWLVRQPGVVEGKDAYDALESGMLQRFDPLELHVVYAKALIAKRAFGIHLDEKMKPKPGGMA